MKIQMWFTSVEVINFDICQLLSFIKAMFVFMQLFQ
jgi:hypothetical protein